MSASLKNIAANAAVTCQFHVLYHRSFFAHILSDRKCMTVTESKLKLVSWTIFPFRILVFLQLVRHLVQLGWKCFYCSRFKSLSPFMFMMLVSLTWP